MSRRKDRALLKIREYFATVVMNKKTRPRRRGGSVTLWAWLSSVVVHLIVLLALGTMTFSGPEESHQVTVPTAQIRQIERYSLAAPAVPKPKVKRAADEGVSNGADEKLMVSQDLGILRPRAQDLGDLSMSASAKSGFSPAEGVALPAGAEFFGSRTEQRKICYVVDCSGSMQGISGRVCKELKESIGRLQQDGYFYVIFFGDDRLIESGEGRLIRATQKARTEAYNFIDSVRPAGKTNAMAALERAVQIRDGGGQPPSIIYFLTDGFELSGQDVYRFGRQISGLLEQFAPTTRINTIGFWPAGKDRRMLEMITKQSGGEFVLITD